MMEYTTEQITEAFEKETPDERVCLHMWQTRVIQIEGDDGTPKYGVVARALHHGPDGELKTVDLLITDVIVAEMTMDLVDSGTQIASLKTPDPIAALFAMFGVDLPTAEGTAL